MSLEEKISKEIIWKIIKYKDTNTPYNQSGTMDYAGFNFHDSNNELGEQNQRVLIMFEDFIPHINRIREYLRFWKGGVWISNGEDTESFGGWTTVDILYWLIHNSEEFFRLPNIRAEERRLQEKAIKMKLLVEKIEMQIISRVISYKDRYEVCKRQHWKCNICGEQLKYKKTSDWSGEVAHIDHIHPFSKKESYSNGAKNINEISNLQALCPDCNLKKGKREIN